MATEHGEGWSVEGVGEREEEESPDTTGDSWFIGADWQRLNHGAMSPARTFSLLLSHGKGYLIIFVDSTCEHPAIKLAAIHKDGTPSLLTIDRLTHQWVLEGEDFHGQHFASLSQLLFFYSMRNQHIVPLENTAPRREPNEEAIVQGTLIASEFDTIRTTSPAPGSDTANRAGGASPPRLRRTETTNFTELDHGTGSTTVDLDAEDRERRCTVGGVEWSIVTQQPTDTSGAAQRPASQAPASLRSRAETLPAQALADTSANTAPPVQDGAMVEEAAPEHQRSEAPDVGHIEYTLVASCALPPQQLATASSAEPSSGATPPAHDRRPPLAHTGRQSIDSSIQQEVTAILEEDVATHHWHQVRQGQRVDDSIRRHTDQLQDPDKGCTALCCGPIGGKCSCSATSGGLWPQCGRSCRTFLEDRCCPTCSAGRTEADSGQARVLSTCRHAAVCCCYVDCSEMPLFSVRRRGLGPMLALVVLHFLWALVYLLALTGRLAIRAILYLYAAVEQLDP